MCGITLLCLLFGPALSAHSAPAVELDHVLIHVTRGAPEAHVLTDAGFLIRPDTTFHTGQGTASFSMLFDNAYVELLWVTDSAALRAASDDLADRLLTTDATASPLGLGLRRTDSLAALPFATTPYAATWMAPGTSIQFASTGPTEPIIFVVPPSMALTALTAGKPPLTSFLPHGTGSHAITAVRLRQTGGQVTGAALAYLARTGVITLRPDTGGPLLELELDGGAAGRTLDARPSLPIVINY